jgi:hypothetical protein
VFGVWGRWRDAHEKRARARRRTEEVLAWICVPAFLMLGYYVWEAWEREVASRVPAAQEQRPVNGVRPVTR